MHSDIRPLRGTNAIEAFGLIIRMATEATGPAFQNLIALARNEANAGLNLPAEAPLQGFRLQLGLNAQAIQAPVNVLGSTFQRFSPKGEVEAELRIDSKSITFVLAAYESWSSARAQITEHVIPLATAMYGISKSLDSYALQYQNRFLTVKEGETTALRGFNWTSLINPETRWASSGFVGDHRFWHSHVGLFEQADDALRRLINVNVDAADYLSPSGAVPSLSVATMVSDQFAAPGLLPARPLQPNRFEEHALRHIHGLRDRAKAILRDILSEGCRERISFDKGIIDAS